MASMAFSIPFLAVKPFKKSELFNFAPFSE